MRRAESTPDRQDRGPQRRGQTTLDFAVGTTLFLLVLTVVFLFVPGSLQPFTEGGQEKVVTVNRIADSLTGGALAEPTSPNVLETDCTVEFFSGTDAPPPDCGYSGSDLHAQLGLHERRSVNVTLRGNISGGGDTDGLLCWDGGAEELKERRNCDSADELLAIGDTGTAGAQSAVTARRVVSVEDEDVYLVVELW